MSRNDKHTYQPDSYASLKNSHIPPAKRFEDSRGYFMESFNLAEFEEKTDLKMNFIQDNESKSSYGVFRGLHYQKGEFAQAKLVRVIVGKVLDIAVDIRKESETFGQYVAVELSGDNKKQLFIPRGFAHGFCVLSDEAIFAYKVDNVYAPQADAGIIWNDPDIDLEIPVLEKDLIFSDKDLKHPLLRDAEVF